ncbi:Fe-S oxidoreductase [Gottschalkia acidurici 9a]|uniref:Fe-S oxidoreductase n=1 Tax=Gottschalkia acidurici (strain ATCC 7906 / DSM 604 / BCRC 14475 / CIP 104303 / KCTC 5404 / NCIMB 10678 / 9a) TaxID=1128398 RepID=K0B0T3_GOTA9|nr:(Fe-S)-binding protein [Gottschalkia acidurici]AFS79633.1 Fe-S oxidoreductase [Gottschalkia acidurici 9a]
MRKIKISKEIIKKIEEENEKCIGCKLCMKNCPMLDEFCNTPKELLERIKNNKEIDEVIPYSCALCNYCTQVCSQDVNLKDIFYNLRTHIVDTNQIPPKELGYSAVKFHQKNSFSKMFSTGIKGLESKEKRTVFFPGCSLSSYSPDVVMKTYQYLKEKLPGIGIILKCCGNPTHTMGEKEKFNDFYNTVQTEFKNNKIKEVIVACQNCYKTIEKNSPNIVITSLWEVISQYGVPEDKKDYYKCTDKTFSIHDPCPTRNESKIHDAIRNITLQLGLKINEMEFIREKTLCCGSGAMIGVTNKDLSLKQRQKRANQSKSNYIISYCEECVESMKKGGKKSIHILDLLFNDDIDKTFNQEDIGTIKKWSNRYKVKRRIASNVRDKEK